MVTRNRETGVHTAIAVPILRRKYSMKLPNVVPSFLNKKEGDGFIVRSTKQYFRIVTRVVVFSFAVILPICILVAAVGGA